MSRSTQCVELIARSIDTFGVQISYLLDFQKVLRKVNTFDSAIPSYLELCWLFPTVIKCIT